MVLTGITLHNLTELHTVPCPTGFVLLTESAIKKKKRKDNAHPLHWVLSKHS